jgi:colanic acid/amylovoran biosynthesis protein
MLRSNGWASACGAHSGRRRPEGPDSMRQENRAAANEAGRPEVCLLGASLKTGNNGVSALTASLAKMVLTTLPQARITLLIGSRTAAPHWLEVDGRPTALQVVNYRLSPRASPGEHLLGIFLLSLVYRLVPWPRLRRRLLARNHFLSAVAGCDFIGDIWAGDSFSDLYGLPRLVVGALPKLIIRLLGRRFVFLPQTYGPFRSVLARRLAALLLRSADLIMTRDLKSIPVIRKVAGNKLHPTRIRFCPDVAFMLDAGDAARRELESSLQGRPAHLVGVNVSGLLYQRAASQGRRFRLRVGYESFVLTLVRSLLEEKGVQIVLVPHTYSLSPPGLDEDDYLAALALRNCLESRERERVHLLEREYDQYEVKGLIGGCEFFVGSRLHACIAALSQGIPTIGISYSRKFAGVFETIGEGCLLIDAQKVDADRALQAVLSAYRRRGELGASLHERATAIRAQVRQEFAALLEEQAAKAARVRQFAPAGSAE